MTTAVLGVEIKTDAARAAVDLDRFRVSAQNAEGAATKLATGTTTAASAARQLTGAAEREAQALSTSTLAVNANSRALEVNGIAARMAATAQRASMFQSRQLMFQLVDLGQTVPLMFQSPLYALQNIGFQVAQIGQLYAGSGGVTAALRDSAAMAGRFAASIGPVGIAVGAVAAAGIAGFAGLTREINKTAGIAVSFGDTFLATWQVVRDSVYDFVKPAFEQIGQWTGQLWDLAQPGIKGFGNGLVRGVVGAVEMVKFGINSIPEALIVAAQTGANGFITGIEWMAQKAVDAFNLILESANSVIEFFGADKAAEMFGWSGKLSPAGPVNLGRVDIGGAGAAARLAQGGLGDALRGIAGTDYLGGLFGDISSRARELASAKTVLDEAGGAARAANRSLGDLASDGLSRAGNAAMEFAQAIGGTLRGAFTGFFTGLSHDIGQGISFFEALKARALESLSSIADKMIDMTSNSLFSSLFGGVLGSGGLGGAIYGGPPLVGAGLFHQGGIAGAASATRFVHPAYFDNAPRYHKGGIAGLAPNEVPAILQRGERVTPTGAPAPAGGDGIVFAPTTNIDARYASAGTAEMINHALAARDRAWREAFPEMMKRAHSLRRL